MTNDEVLKLDFSDRPLPDAYLLELGRVSALWAGLESFLNMCLGKLAGFNDMMDPRAFIMVTHMSFPQRLDVLSALCEHLLAGYPKLKDYKSVLGDLRHAQKLRNDFMHYAMAEDEATKKVKMAKGTARGTLKVGVDYVSLGDLRKASMAIHEAQLRLYKLVLDRDIPPRWKREGWDPRTS